MELKGEVLREREEEGERVQNKVLCYSPDFNCSRKN